MGARLVAITGKVPLKFNLTGYRVYQDSGSRTLPRSIPCLALCVASSHAGLRGPGKYCGVIIFDRWDTCFLLSGHFIMYISESAKSELRPYVGKAMQLNALEVYQPKNPGDALVRKYQIIGPAPNNHNWVLDGLELVARSDFGLQGTATFLIEVRNTGSKPANVNSSEFGPTLLGLSRKGPFCVSDDKSE